MAQYTAIFEKPYADGYEDLPSQNTPITAETLNDKDDAIVNIESYLSQNDIPTYEEHTNTSGEFKTLSGGILSSCVVNLEPIQSGSGTPSPQNVRPITGHTAVEVDVTDADSNTTQYTVALGQTVYGGSVNAVSGEGSDEWVNIASYNGETITEPWLSSMDEYTSGGTPTTGAQVVYKKATATSFSTTPTNIETLIGQNNISIPLEGQSLDSLSYREVMAWDDVEKAIEPKADISAIGTDESGRTTASRSYIQGEHFYKDGKFGTTKTGVAQGATWTLNTNYVEGDVATEITNKIVTDDFTISVGNVASGTAGAEITQSVAKTGYEAVGVVIREGSGSWWTVCNYLLLIKNNVLSVFANNFSPNNVSSVSIKVRVTYAKI